MIFAPVLLLSSLASAVSAASSPQVVTVGKDGAIKYSPDTLTAAVGSQVEFQFFGPSHSVVQASFDAPCNAIDGGTGFFAGFNTNGDGPNPTSFTITINDTKPVWFYCAFPGHCPAGMVGVINPSSSNKSETLDIFRSNAANVGKSTTPKQQQGGKFGAFVNPSSASTAASGTSTAASGTSTAASGTSTAASGTSTGASSASTAGSSPTKSSSSSTPSATGNEAGQMRGGHALLGGVAVAVAALLV